MEHQGGRIWPETPCSPVEEASTVIEVPGRVVGPTASAVDALVWIFPSHLSDRLSNWLVLNGRVEFDATVFPCVLPVGPEVVFL